MVGCIGKTPLLNLVRNVSQFHDRIGIVREWDAPYHARALFGTCAERTNGICRICRERDKPRTRLIAAGIETDIGRRKILLPQLPISQRPTIEPGRTGCCVDDIRKGIEILRIGPVF